MANNIINPCFWFLQEPTYMAPAKAGNRNLLCQFYNYRENYNSTAGEYQYKKRYRKYTI
jgi:hypothetical protein